MATRLLVALVCSFMALTLGACKKNLADQKAAAEAKWRSEQRQKAKDNYQKIVTKYPDSPFAAEAQKRLNALGPAATPGKK
jgi:outer membrane protein assembly factor BamD (BamD/ComL family)